jgi:hypothetical protein
MEVLEGQLKSLETSIRNMQAKLDANTIPPLPNMPPFLSMHPQICNLQHQLAQHTRTSYNLMELVCILMQ